ncbi:ecotropic viral integration site 5 ortholog isoform X1 [Amyelois transitella]|uniref:ecotropic viral integration site 5 ortholog isoform X1 n=1 Tax=Amyelois transitella TaxID=680683 RepID=UPI00067D4FF1|nr:ecotropic viral integration site 5 ortholog isoform X1 [Amyelois transitella]XP_013189299.1 ecotropic viral integration site 5 ortholog isoform X1 [Amyelois transitella]XP_060809801.1 ecotropic viral integration site 5 ortholog isoform X1 [Amyelois transitella]
MKVESEAREAPVAPSAPSGTPIASNTESPVSSLDDCREECETIPTPARALLAKLEEENRRIEADAKSASLTNVHSRKSSDTSQISLASATSSSLETEARVSGTNGEEDLWSLWGRIVSNWETEWKRRNQFVRDLVRQGVPHHFRGIVWQLLAGVDSSPEKKLYASYIKAKSACEKVIRRDIARTYPEHDFFKEKDGLGQESLFNVMKAYSLHDREVGYCQGSGFIVGLLLMQMPEEEAFAVLVKIMQQHRMRDMFKPSMAELGLCMFQLENLVQELLPDLHGHFQAQSFSTSIYASSWFLTLFTTTLTLPLACRVMDVFLSEGIEIVFKVALAMLTLGKNDLLSLDMENILKYIQKELPAKAEADQDMFMSLAYSIKVNPKKMKKLEKEYTVIKTKEQGDIAVLRCLRQENRLLKQRVELLEKESSSLAERLLRGQVDRAEGEEEAFALAREVQALRRANVDAQQRLAVAQDEIRSLEMTIAENNSRQSSLEGIESSSGAKGEELARCLQRELVRARLHAAEREAAERELTARIAELESENKSLRRQRVDNNVAHLQDELIAVKLREAEANLSLKELRQRVAELSETWQRHLQEHRQETPAPPVQSNVVSDIMATPKKLLRAWEGRSADMQKLDEELMSTKMRELEALTELKELRLKVMELETQVQVSTNQLRRQDEEARQLRDALDAAMQRERGLQARQREFQHKYTDLESKAKYESMQANIRNMEDAQRIAELETEVSEYKLKNEVMATEGELRSNNMDDSDRVRELQEQVAELKAEVMRLEAWRARALGHTELSRAISVEEDLEEDEKLKLILRRESSTSLELPPTPRKPT